MNMYNSNEKSSSASPSWDLRPRHDFINYRNVNKATSRGFKLKSKHFSFKSLDKENH